MQAAEINRMMPQMIDRAIDNAVAMDRKEARIVEKPAKGIEPDIVEAAQMPDEVGTYMHLIEHDALRDIPDGPDKTDTLKKIEDRHYRWQAERNDILARFPAPDFQSLGREAIIELGAISQSLKNDVDREIDEIRARHEPEIEPELSGFSVHPPDPHRPCRHGGVHGVQDLQQHHGRCFCRTDRQREDARAVRYGVCLHPRHPESRMGQPEGIPSIDPVTREWIKTHRTRVAVITKSLGYTNHPHHTKHLGSAFGVEVPRVPEDPVIRAKKLTLYPECRLHVLPDFINPERRNPCDRRGDVTQENKLTFTKWVPKR